MSKQATTKPTKVYPHWVPTGASALKIALVYGALSTVWVFASGWALHRFIHAPCWVAWLENMKGWLFVLVTTCLLGLVLTQYFRKIQLATKKLQEREALLQLVGDNLPNGYIYQYTRGSDGVPQFTHVSAGVERVHGLKVSDVLRDADCLLKQIDLAQREAFTNAEAESARDLKDLELELRMHRPDGAVRLIHVCAQPRRTEAGNVQWEGFALDVTERKKVEEAQQEYERLANAALNSLSAHIAILDHTGTIVAVNRAWRQFAEANRTLLHSVLEGANYLTVCEAAQGAEAAPARAFAVGIRDVMAGRVDEFVQEYSCHAPSQKRWFTARVSRFAGQGPLRLVVAHENITERKLAEDSLLRNGELLRDMGQMSKVGGWDLDPATGEGHWTEEVARIHDLDPSVLPNQAMGLSFYSGESRKRIEAALAAAWAEGTPYDLELEMLSAKGQHKWVRTIGQPVMENGKVVKLHGSFQDITERKRTEEALRLSEMKFARAFANNPTAIALTRLEDGVVLDVNDTWLTMTRFTRAEVLGQTARSLWKTPEAGEAFLRELREHGVVRGWEQEFRNRTGELYTAQMSAQILSLNGEQVVLSTLVDLTERRRNEEELRESEHRFRTLVETAPEAIFVRTDKCFVYLNAAAVKLFGAASRDELVGKSVVERFSPECRDIIATRMDRLDEAGESTMMKDRRLLKLDGTPVDVSISAVPITFRSKPSALVFARDVSDRKRAETAMLQQIELQNQLSKIAATVPGTIYSFRLRPDGSMAMPYTSAAIKEMFGIKPEQVREDAALIWEFIHPEDVERIQESIAASARTLKPWRQEFRARNTPRGEIWIEGHSVPQFEPDGSILWHGFLHDITERKAAEAKLRKLSRAVEQCPVSIVITDAAGKIEYVNPKFTELTGYSLDEVRGRNPRLLKAGTTSAQEYRELWQTILRGETWRGEFQNRKKDGQRFNELASISPITDEAGRITHFLAVKEDVTERRQLEAQFRQAQKLDAIGQLAGGVAHDFNNILAVMMMQAELSAMVKNTPIEVKEGLQQIHAATERAAALTRQLLLFSRKQVLQPRDLDLNEVVKQLAKMLQRIIREDVRLQLKLHPEPLITHADAGMLDQVLMNLAVNARDAMPDGGRLLIETDMRTFDAESARVHPDASPGRYVWLSVTDTGTGMSPEIMARIFEPFFTTKEPGKGTGLGLATVFGIVKQHHGWITVHSDPGQGANFQVFLPACATGTSGVVEPATQRPRGGTETILVAEDDPALRRITRALLEQSGYTVLEASSGPEAMGIWSKQADAIALLLTDLVMPGGMSGLQLARELKTLKPSLRVIFASGYSAEIAGTEFPLRNGENFVQKPYAPYQLLQVVRQSLDS